jgi:transcriptional regulator with XRE-family HTH domain
MDTAMKNAVDVFERSGKTLEELGKGMGYGDGVARRAAWQFLHKTSDPRLSMLRRFAKAMDVDVRDLIVSERKAKTTPV